MAKISKDPATEVTGRGDPGVPAVLPAPTFGCCAQALALQKTEAEAGNGDFIPTGLCYIHTHSCRGLL